MCTSRAVMATTTLEGLAARACGFPGSEMVIGVEVGALVLWTWRVWSQEAEMSMAMREGLRVSQRGRDLRCPSSVMGVGWWLD